MKNNLILNEQAINADQILQVTALLYLKEALLNQEYEVCAELVGTARNLGVTAADISEVLGNYAKKAGGTQAEAKKEKSRLSSL